jgi:hypothetical protein
MLRKNRDFALELPNIKYIPARDNAIIRISLWAETKDSITTSGFRAKKTRLKVEFSSFIFLDIFSIKKQQNKNADTARNLKRKKVKRKILRPKNDNGIETASQNGPYG